MQASDQYENSVNDSETIETLDLNLPLSTYIMKYVYLLTTALCDGVCFPCDAEKMPQILIAFDYLEIDYEKLVDVFITQNDAPLHLRLKTIDLFCINIVYLLEKWGLLAKYQSFFTAPERRAVECAYDENLVFEDNDNNIVELIKKIGPLPHYIYLLQMKLRKGDVQNLYLGTDSAYFVYNLLHEGNAKCIRLQHKNDYDESSVKIDLLVELNTLNRHMENRKLEILLPCCRDYFYKDWNPTLKFTSSDIIVIHSYTHVMSLFSEITEVSIINLIHYCDNELASQRIKEYVDGLLEVTVIKAIKQLAGLSALFIQGFHIFPNALIPVLKKLRLKKFGVMSTCAVLDYLVIYRLFDENSPLKKSISHFVGHFRALLFLSKFLAKDQIKEVTLTNTLRGVYVELFEDEKIVFELIKNHFYGGCIHGRIILEERLQINTVYNIELERIMHARKMSTFRPLIAGFNVPQGYEYGEIAVTQGEIAEGCSFDNMILCYVSRTGFFFWNIAAGTTKSFKSVELVIKDHECYNIDKLLNKLGNYRNKLTCLVLNINANRFLHEYMDNKLKLLKAANFYSLVKYLIIDNRNY
ncbi:hypothetical protein ENBRE01_1322 [Enteropsectra breve]|nr:hypothetical protein ENBRE01_1322 [Enteropsectra breve]